MRLRLLPSFLLSGLLSGCLPAGGSGVGAPPGAPQPARVAAAQEDPTAALQREFEALAPADQRITVTKQVGFLKPVGDARPTYTMLHDRQATTPERYDPWADFTLQIDLSRGAPIYRVILSNATFGPDILTTDLPDLRAVFVIKGDGAPDYDRSGGFVVPDFATSWKGDGLFVSDWLACDHCIPSLIGPWNEQTSRFEQMKTVDRLAAVAAGRGRRFIIPTILFETTRDDVRKSIVAGRAAAEAAAAAAETASRLDRHRGDRAVGRTHEPEYFAFRKEIEPLTLDGHIRALGCPRYYQERTQGGPRQWRELIAHNDAFIDCRIRAIDTYDHAGFAERFPEIAAREKALAAKARGVNRPPLYTPEGQVREVIQLIERAEAANERGADAISWLRDERAKRERSHQRRQAMLRDFQSVIDSARAEVHDMTPVVRADGTLSTAGQERQRAQAANQASASAGRSGTTASGGRASGAGGLGRTDAPSAPRDGGRYSLYLVTPKGKVDDRCNPLNAMSGDRLARCRVVDEIRQFVVTLATCRALSGGATQPAEVVRKTTHLILDVDGLTADERDRLQKAADSSGRPYFASPSPDAVRSMAHRDYAGFGSVAPGVRTYYASEARMTDDLRAAGCASYELNGETRPTR